MSWWSEWLIPLLVASFFLMAVKSGWFLILFLWLLYLGNASNQIDVVEKINGKDPARDREFQVHACIGLVVLVVTGIICLVV